MKTIKVIDLAIGFSKGIIPPKIKYKGVVYTYWKTFKEYFLIENNTIIKSLSINVEQFNDEVEIIEEEPRNIEVCGSFFTKSEYDELAKSNEDKKIERVDRELDNDGYLSKKLNEIIDKVNGE